MVGSTLPTNLGTISLLALEVHKLLFDLVGEESSQISETSRLPITETTLGRDWLMISV